MNMYALYADNVRFSNNGNRRVMVDYGVTGFFIYAFFEKYEEFYVSLWPANG